MPSTVITIVAPKDGGIDENIQNKAATLVKEQGVEGLSLEVLEKGRAFDVIASPNTPELMTKLREKFSAFGSFDIFVQANDEFRRKKLLVADMDATMIEGETLDELAAHFGLKDKIAPITASAMRGEIDFAEALAKRVKLLSGLPAAALYETLAQVKYSAGASKLVKTMGRHGARCVLISGGFTLFTSAVAQTLGFHVNIGNRLGIANDKLTGEVLPPIVDKLTKKKTVEEEARKLGADPRCAVAVGDGANDIPMLQTAGAGVGYFGKPAVVAATPHQIRHTDLSSILYMQGYKREEITG